MEEKDKAIQMTEDQFNNYKRLLWEKHRVVYEDQLKIILEEDIYLDKLYK